MGERVKVLITVKTYPSPSLSYEEVVCTAGVQEDGSFIRLYPIDYRYRSNTEWYEKYQWVEVEIKKHRKDPRPESFRPIGEIKTLGQPIGTENNWAERKRYVFAKGISTMCQLQRMSKEKQVSLGIIKPQLVEDFLIEETERNWNPKWVAQMNQLKLFGPDRKPLDKIPYKFYYKFICQEPECRGHKMANIDWEVGQLYRSMRSKYDDETLACDKVKEKFFGEICGLDKDTHFFVGTILEYGTWVVLGTFWPKKEKD